MTMTDAALAALMEPARVDRAAYVDPAVFELELERIFGRAWLYVAHASQLRRPGDFVGARLGRDKIIAVRQDDGSLRAFFNRCPHRGADVCSAAAGNTRTFLCPYHAWSFRTDGTLDAIPHGPAGYGAALPAKLAALGLERVARVDDYRGFVFACRAADGPGLAEFLGPDVRAVFDNFVDRAPAGALEVAGGRLVQRFRANWKLQIENSIDLLHPSILHRNAIDAAAAHVPSDDIDPGARIAIELNGQNLHSFRGWDEIPVHALENGHCYMGTFFKKTDRPAEAGARFGSDDAFRFATQADYKARLVARHGAEAAEGILSFSRHNTIVYPNLFVNPRLQQIRVLNPVAVDCTEQHSQVLRLVGAPDEVFQVAVRILTAANSPASLATSDDHEVFEQIQAGLRGGDRPHLDFSRNFDPAGEPARAPGTSELPMRNQHRAWLRYMTGRG
jgi:phenylpropionate dioxygenase-like ring-hydroxylating dioxygenase large terminal subunit